MGETGRGLSVRLEEHRRACTLGQENNAVAIHSLSLDHRINFKNSKIVYKEPNVTKRRVIEGALIHSSNTFKHNKPFHKEDDIISNSISYNVLKLAAHTPVVSHLSIAQAEGGTSDASTDAGSDQRNDNQPPSNPQALRRSQRIRNRQQQDLHPPD